MLAFEDVDTGSEGIYQALVPFLLLFYLLELGFVGIFSCLIFFQQRIVLSAHFSEITIKMTDFLLFFGLSFLDFFHFFLKFSILLHQSLIMPLDFLTFLAQLMQLAISFSLFLKLIPEYLFVVR